MDSRKLFHVLVIGGAMLGTACVEAPPPATDDAARPGDDDSGTPPEVDAATDPEADAATPATDAGTPEGDAGPLMECGFCPNDVCCVTDEMGMRRLREGMMCCWSTSC